MSSFFFSVQWSLVKTMQVAQPGKETCSLWAGPCRASDWCWAEGCGGACARGHESPSYHSFHLGDLIQRQTPLPSPSPATSLKVHSRLTQVRKVHREEMTPISQGCHGTPEGSRMDGIKPGKWRLSSVHPPPTDHGPCPQTQKRSPWGTEPLTPEALRAQNPRQWRDE